MNKTKTQTLTMLLLVAALLGLFWLFNHQPDTSSVMTSQTDAAILEKDHAKETASSLDQPSPPLDSTLLHIAQMIAPASNEALKDSWRQEYTCDGLDNCNKLVFNARSYEDALWLKRRGYPTRSMLNMLVDLSKADLLELSDNGNLNATNLLALHALNNNNNKRAKSLAGNSSARSTYGGSRETFAYRLLAEAHLRDNEWSLATVYLRMASLMGDTNATDRYEQLTARTASTVVDDTNRMAFSLLSSMLNTDINSWNNDPRPEG